MAALTQAYEAQEKEGLLIAYPIKANTKIWKGALVCVDPSGYLMPATDTAGIKFVGIAFETVDNSTGTNGGAQCKVLKRGTFVYNRSGAYTQADVGAVVKAVSDNEVAKTSANNVNVGSVVELVGSSGVRIRIDNYTM